jgi:mannose-6-phosphate isomerase-like protein (cupin superfamily)
MPARACSTSVVSGQGFSVVLGDAHSQAAQMTLAPGESEGRPDNRHHGADQWLFVVAGTGEAVLNGEMVPLKAGTLLLISRGEELPGGRK